MNAQTSSASLTAISSESYKQVLEIKICLCCITVSRHCSQMLWGLNSYLKSKDILPNDSWTEAFGYWRKPPEPKAGDSRDTGAHAKQQDKMPRTYTDLRVVLALWLYSLRQKVPFSLWRGHDRWQKGTSIWELIV